ncbi:uncharacterized protein RCC_02111 [Ramularia collo-cygni]|uniref:Uncharacterized protein n=1 Tax=Ramularia collo-cygni TaxID=112498 RepID=A0A2D3V438_9PEZI|nr:uncharacterized protein RCC_02111 [Ramularia collo-cygni]CZT16269.1 uncharacterized protein RCC_02111 [Ramularia collo-cygni]
MQPVVTPTPSTKIEDLRIPAGITEWEVLSYSLFMKKLQKLNPGVQYTRALADEALEKSLRSAMPKFVWKAVQSMLHGENNYHKVRSTNIRKLVHNWRRLQTESTAYWTESTQSGDGTSQ